MAAKSFTLRYFSTTNLLKSQRCARCPTPGVAPREEPDASAPSLEAEQGQYGRAL